MNCTDFHLLGLRASGINQETGEFEEGKETRTKEGRDRDRKRQKEGEIREKVAWISRFRH